MKDPRLDPRVDRVRNSPSNLEGGGLVLPDPLAPVCSDNATTANALPSLSAARHSTRPMIQTSLLPTLLIFASVVALIVAYIDFQRNNIARELCTRKEGPLTAPPETLAAIARCRRCTWANAGNSIWRRQRLDQAANKPTSPATWLLATLQLPFSDDPRVIANECAFLNYFERMSWTDIPLFGCWHPHVSRP